MDKERLSFTFQRLASELEGFGDGLLRKEFDMTHNQFQFMVTLQNLEAADVTTLARHLSVSKAAVSKRVTWFVHRGLVSISHEIKGNRRLFLSLTPKGQRMLKSAKLRLDAEFAQFSKSFSDIDVDQLHQGASELLTRMLTLRGKDPKNV